MIFAQLHEWGFNVPIKSVTVRVPAKVNLQLSVGPRESDGYHQLVTVFQAISIFDDHRLPIERKAEA